MRITLVLEIKHPQLSTLKDLLSFKADIFEEKRSSEDFDTDSFLDWKNGRRYLSDKHDALALMGQSLGLSPGATRSCG